jgi:hypothetical protein
MREYLLLTSIKMQMLAGFLAMILMPIGWMMWTDYADKKRAATYANLKKEK